MIDKDVHEIHKVLREIAPRCIHAVSSRRNPNIFDTCNKVAPYMVDGCSYCRDHVKHALRNGVKKVEYLTEREKP